MEQKRWVEGGKMKGDEKKVDDKYNDIKQREGRKE